VKRVPGVTTNMSQGPEGLSNRSPDLTIRWESPVAITAPDVARILLDTEPRITLARATGNSIQIVPYQMSAGDEKIVADRLYAVLSRPPKVEPPPKPQGTPASIAGQWDVRLEFNYGAASHSVILEQEGTRLMGTHHGEFAAGDLNGSVAANSVTFQSSLPTHGTRVSFQFNGTVADGKMSGTVLLGEYGEAKWTAERHQYRSGRRNG
jgi:hypothetical protein